MESPTPPPGGIETYCLLCSTSYIDICNILQPVAKLFVVCNYVYNTLKKAQNYFFILYQERYI